MKTYIRTIAGSFILAISLSFTLPSCSESHAGNPKETISGPVDGIPYLKDRVQGLGSVEERVHVAHLYDRYKSALSLNGNDAEAWLGLAELFMNEARVTGEHPYYYPAALQMIDAIPNMNQQSEDVRFKAGYFKSSVLLSMHEFQKALQAGSDALKLYPMNAGIHGVLIDANVELGNYEEAVRLSDQMVGLRPDLRSYSRISYLREIHGDFPGAIEAMKMAVEAGMPGYEQTAWCRLTLGRLYENTGQLDEAKMHYTLLLEERADYPFAYAGLSSVAMKQGNLQEAEAQIEKAIALIPEVAFYEQKAEILRKTNRDAEAKSILDEVLVMMAEDAASGHKMDLELAGVYLHLRNEPQKALEYAEKALMARPANIDVNAMLAEIHYGLGNMKDASSYLKTAMRTGSTDPHKNLLAGMIHLKTGEQTVGKLEIKSALSMNPYMDSEMAQAAKLLF